MSNSLEFHQSSPDCKCLYLKDIFKNISSNLDIDKKDEIPESITQLINTTIKVNGWISTVRAQKSICFISLNDGTHFNDLQIILDVGQDNTQQINQAEIVEKYDSLTKNLTKGVSLSVKGEIIVSPAKGQLIEMKTSLDNIHILGKADSSTYPISKKKHSMEFLREHLTFRPRTKIGSTVARIRTACSMATHLFFTNQDFQYVHTPILSSSDCEGAGEAFLVTTLCGENTQTIPTIKTQVENKPPPFPCTSSSVKDTHKIDYSKDFFKKKTYLTVSGQLHVEAFATALTKVYTFGPTFRAENSHTSRHLAEFWMIEPEICFCTFSELIDLAKNYLQYVVKYVMDTLPEEIDYLDKFISKGLKSRLINIVESPFKIMTYTQAIEELTNDYDKVSKCNKKSEFFEFKYPKPAGWGEDMGSEQEKYLTAKYGPVIITDYPKDIKSFYMKESTPAQDVNVSIEPLSSECCCDLSNENVCQEAKTFKEKQKTYEQNKLSNDRKTVQAMDVLIPGIGEVIGGSMREDNYEVLKQTIVDKNLPMDNLQWYLDLRKFGTVPHGGFGLGFERMIMLVTGLTCIKDVIPFPRTTGNCDL